MIFFAYQHQKKNYITVTKFVVFIKHAVTSQVLPGSGHTLP